MNQAGSPESSGLTLDDLLRVFDVAAANLEKLEHVWARARPLLPDGPDLSSTTAEYADLTRSWSDLLEGLPSIGGWRVDCELPDPAELGQTYLDYLDIGLPPTGAYQLVEEPEHQLAEYRYRLTKQRRRVTRQRLEELVAEADTTLQNIVAELPPVVEYPPNNSKSKIDTPLTALVGELVREIERILGDTVERRGRWSDLYRHMHFSQPHDWREILEYDWPSVKSDIEAASFDDSDPLPIPAGIDLGSAVASDPTAAVSTPLAWENLDAEQFERLLFDLLEQLPEFTNVTLLTNPNAPDRGRDLAADRQLTAGSDTVRVERVIVQAKHWLSRAVGVTELSETLEVARLWQNPPAEWIIVATSGRFTTNAVDWQEQHNARGQRPLIELWPDSRLERLLSRYPGLPVSYGLR